jgi:hypothetical protein
MNIRGAQNLVRMMGLQDDIIFDDVLLEGPDLAKTRVHKLLRGGIAAGAVLCLLFLCLCVSVFCGGLSCCLGILVCFLRILLHWWDRHTGEAVGW